MKALRVAVFSAVLVLASASVEAYPILQLDIIGGHYDAATQTIVSSGPDFTLVAVLTPQKNKALSPYLNDTYYISAAVSPQHGPDDTSLGTFTWNDTNYLVTEDMTYGTPPLEGVEAHRDSGDLAPHSIFPTFFSEFGFQFSEDNRAVSYNTAENPGGFTTTTATTDVSYFATFNVTTSLIGDNVLHFDLYNSLLRTCRRNEGCTIDEDVDLFAPFSHDAEGTVRHSVAEPQSMLAMSVGLLIAARMLRRVKRA